MSLSPACRVYFPSRSVTVPIVVPLINTFAPIRGSLASLSITVPLTVCVCAYNAVICPSAQTQSICKLEVNGMSSAKSKNSSHKVRF